MASCYEHGRGIYWVGLCQWQVSEWLCFVGLEYMSGSRMSNGGSFVGGGLVDMQHAASELQVRRKFHYENLRRWHNLKRLDVWTDWATGCPTERPCSDRGNRSFCCPAHPHWVRGHPVGTWSYFPGRKATVPRLSVPGTVIPRLTKIIRSGITFVSRNVISRRFL